MSRLANYIAIGIVCVLIVPFIDIHAQTNETNPITNNGKKWQIGYLEGGSYANYQSILEQMIVIWMGSGWIERASIPKSQDGSETRTLWNFLSTKIKSDYLEFPADNYWNCKWDNTERGKLKKSILKRLNIKKDIDLMLCFGTWAGQDLANNQHSTPVMVLSASNAVQSGIIKGVEDPGFDHVHAWIDPKKSERQLRLFHEITGFKRLGLVYDDDLDGRSYAAVDDVLRLSRELGFEVVECHTPLGDEEVDLEEAQLIECYEKLAPKIDSIYITDDAGLTKNSITKLLPPLFKHKVLMFAQTRYDLIKNGILMGADKSDFNADARFYTDTFARILNGAKPGDLSQKFESPLDIAVNLESAKKIGFRFPLDILAGAFEIHKTIQNPKNE